MVAGGLGYGFATGDEPVEEACEPGTRGWRRRVHCTPLRHAVWVEPSDTTERKVLVLSEQSIEVGNTYSMLERLIESLEIFVREPFLFIIDEARRIRVELHGGEFGEGREDQMRVAIDSLETDEHDGRAIFLKPLEHVPKPLCLESEFEEVEVELVHHSETLHDGCGGFSSLDGHGVAVEEVTHSGVLCIRAQSVEEVLPVQHAQVHSKVLDLATGLEDEVAACSGDADLFELRE